MSRPKMPSLDRIKASDQFIGKGLVIDLPAPQTRVIYQPCGWMSIPITRKVYDFTVWHKLLNSPMNLEG